MFIQLNKLLELPGNPTGEPTLRMASSLPLREIDSGGTEIVGFDPTLPLNVDDKELGTGRRDARRLRSKIERVLEETGANP